MKVEDILDDIFDDYDYDPGSSGGSTNTSPGNPDVAAPDVSVPDVSAPEQVAGRRCWDVTSYDYDWGNDMLCQRLDG